MAVGLSLALVIVLAAHTQATKPKPRKVCETVEGLHIIPTAKDTNGVLHELAPFKMWLAKCADENTKCEGSVVESYCRTSYSPSLAIGRKVGSKGPFQPLYVQMPTGCRCFVRV